MRIRDKKLQAVIEEFEEYNMFIFNSESWLSLLSAEVMQAKDPIESPP